MSSNAPRQQFAQVHLSHRLFRVQVSSDALQPYQRWPPTGTKWDEENCQPQLLLRRLCKGLRENDGNLSQKHTEAFHFQRKSNPIAPFEMASGLLQVSSPSVEKRLPWSHAGFHGDGAARLPIQFQSALLLLQSVDKSID